MLKQKITIVLSAVLIFVCIFLCSCGSDEPQLTATAPKVQLTPQPSHSPKLDSREKIILNGTAVDCYTDSLSEGVRYVLLRDVMSAIESDYIYDSNLKQWQFHWRDKSCSLTKDSQTLIYGDKSSRLDTVPFVCRIKLEEEPPIVIDEEKNTLSYGDEYYSLDKAPKELLKKANQGTHASVDNQVVITPEPYLNSDYLFIPIESFCEGLEIGSLYDDANNTLYLSPGAGNWILPEGYSVPIIMHFATGEQKYTDYRFRYLDDIEKEFQYLSANGYTFIWFDDLWNVDNIEKPVIMTFDDGWVSHYDYLMPIAKKYNAKVTEFLVPGNMDSNLKTDTQVYMNTKQLKEFLDTGLLSLQCHTMNESYSFKDLSESEMEQEIVNCKMFITRLTGQIPIAFAFPYGEQYGAGTGFYNDFVIQKVKENYRFAAVSRDHEHSYVTGNNPYKIPRYCPEYTDTQDKFIYYFEHHGIPEDVYHHSS